MLPDNPFLQLTLPRVHAAVGRLQALLWQEVAPVACSFAGAGAVPVTWEAAHKLKFKSIQLPFHWGRLFDVGWFKLVLPPVLPKGQLYLNWQDQGEGTAYVDGVPYFGFDVAHRHCPLPEAPGEIFMESLCLQSAIWHPEATGLDPQGSKLSRAAIVTRNDLAWETLHDLRTLYDLALEESKAHDPASPPKLSGAGFQPLPNLLSPLYRRVLRTLDDAVNAFDREGLPGLRQSLRNAYRVLEGRTEMVRAVLTGHAHIDLVWLWPERVGEYKTTHTFATMNRLMDAYPEFIFGSSQPAVIESVEKISPRLMRQVRRRIASGRWETLGATLVESDTLMACGEALARSFMLGQQSFAQLQGKASRVLWIPDVFGYSGCLPQIMRQAGVDYFFTTKLTWSNINAFPYSSFVWRGIDGSEVLAHVTQENGYNQTAVPEELRRGARAYRQSDVHEEFLCPTGYGDGGGGVTEEMCERARRMKSLAGLPETAWGRVDDFFDRLAQVRARLPVWQGELYLEYHRGVLTTHGDLKAGFRACERALQTWEAARCASGGGEIDEQPWRRLIFAQFHDYIPGSSIWEVYEEGLPELAAITENALESAARDLGHGESRSLFNPLPVERIHVLEDGSKAVRLLPLTGAPFAELRALEPARPVIATTKKIESGQVRAKFDAKGRVTALAFGENEVPLHGPLGELVLYPDQPHNFEAWDIDRQTLSLGSAVEFPAKASIVQAGGVQGAVEFTRKLGRKSSVSVRYRLDAFQPILHLEYEIDWHEEQTLLKVLFPTAYNGRLARFGAPFGSVRRGQQPGAPSDEAMFESAGSRWAIVMDDADSEGLAFVTEAKYGFSCREGVLGVSLVRSPRVTGEDAGNARLFPEPLRRGAKRPAFSDQGRHVIRLAISLHTAQTPRALLAPMLADTLFTAPLAYTGPATSAGLLGIDGLESVVPCWAKPAADGKGWVLRLHETMGRRGKIRVRLSEGLQAFRSELSEKPSAGAVNEVEVAPYELVSLLIRSKSGPLS
ncbi:MAG TPA: glycoside hydrolase family 38 C-terminal domain-containing protein, partial [Candidatus Methylacidiphilales bacterium]|nr:glycoside hydrolase family 38 C-terminal domain-containing protein [Candidatus Methylacidiphilales bacterium]